MPLAMPPRDSYAIRKARAWRDPRVAMLLRSRDNAKIRDIEHTISKDDIQIPEYCPITGLKLLKGGAKRDDATMSLDRIDTKLGYIPGNISVISWRANRLKSNASFEEIENLLKYMKKELTKT